MANATAANPTRLESYWAEVLPPHKAADLFKSLPSHIKPATFERNLLNALMANPDLMQYSPALLYREVAKAAGLGLYLDPQLGEAYVVVAYNFKTQRKEPQLRVGYKGMIKLVRQTGTVATISCHEVHRLDEVEVDFGFPKMFHHRPLLFRERGEIMGYVATVGFKDGSFDLEPISVRQCLAIRDRSDAWRAYKEGKIKSTPWSTDEVEMCRKTGLRRLLKRQEQSPEIVQANQTEDEAEYAPPAIQPPDRLRIDSRVAQEQLAHSDQTNEQPPEQPAPADPPPETEPPVDPKTGEVSPHTIELNNSESGTPPTWQEWGSHMIAAIRSAKTEAEIDAWIECNSVHITNFKTQAANVFRLLENAIRKHREEIKPKPTKQGG